MTTTDDMMGAGREAMEIAAGLNLEIVRDAKEAIQGPAVGRRLEKDERMAKNRALIASPPGIAALFGQLSAQYQLTPEKPISRRLVNRLLRAHRELAAEEEDNAAS